MLSTSWIVFLPPFLALCKMLPVNDLDNLFLFDQTKAVMQIIKNSGCNLIAILCDNNHVNQAFFKMFD